MNITIICSSELHPVNSFLQNWKSKQSNNHNISIIRNKNEALGGDVLFLISCGQKIEASEREKYKKTLVIHASDLPNGKGWNPHIWQILEGKTNVTVTLLEAADKIDSGDIWSKIKCEIPQNALWDEINSIIFDAELQLMDFALENFNTIDPLPQLNMPSDGVYYRLRTPEDSQLDTSRSIADLFNSIRVCDPKRFPAFFEMHGQKYKLTVEKI
ncbi:formyltransferase family protein [Laribacter hongkongensis]|uniref:formyltransferase family protein n=1 Tax=Laribacter hongkongensis TaxID=168471 RepID=UPI001EFCCC67|nr:formyltransferase family protein [Laribacter hongkongensis]MCG9042276.1 hypothetical protein [Laribacter hongkongensis]MCG9057160.1 hypothetical protein [Laribacter hongkongensis]MCG9069195.1 hypothetical protein [Laribacter hongkongensis]